MLLNCSINNVFIISIIAWISCKIWRRNNILVEGFTHSTKHRHLLAVLKCPLTEAKLSNATFEAYFLTKKHANWMHDYLSGNTSNDIFYFSVRVIELEFSR